MLTRILLLLLLLLLHVCKQHDQQQQNGPPIRERLRIGTRPKLRQRRDWETDIESARAAGRDADVYFRERL